MSEQDAYERGSAAGKINERLASHDKHFATINGSLDKIGSEMHSMHLALQSLRDKTVNRDTTRTVVFAVLAALATVIAILQTVKGG